MASPWEQLRADWDREDRASERTLLRLILCGFAAIIGGIIAMGIFISWDEALYAAALAVLAVLFGLLVGR